MKTDQLLAILGAMPLNSDIYVNNDENITVSVKGEAIVHIDMGRVPPLISTPRPNVAKDYVNFPPDSTGNKMIIENNNGRFEYTLSDDWGA